MDKYEKRIEGLVGYVGHTPYNPIILNGEVYRDSIRRVYNKQDKRLDCIDYKNKRVVDVGCYNGFFAVEAMKRGAKSYLGIDANSQSDGLSNVLTCARIVAESNNLKNVSFKKGLCENLSKLFKLSDFDMVTVLSIQDANYLFDNLQLGSVPPWYNFIKEKIVYIEPTNHGRAVRGKKKSDPPYTKVQLRAQLKKAIKNSPDINIEFLAFTEYENRILLRLTPK